MKQNTRRQLPRPKLQPAPVQPKGNGQKSREQQIYEAYENSFSEATENALQSPIWKGLPKTVMQNIKGNTIVFPLNNNFSLMVSIGIEERYHEAFDVSLWWWKIVTCLIVNSTKKLHKQRHWTRKDKLRMMNVSRAILWPLGQGKDTWLPKEHLLVFSKQASDDDCAVIEAVRNELIGQTDPSSPFYGITIEQVERMGMEVSCWKYLSCEADFGSGEDWTTLQFIESKVRRQGHATYLLQVAKVFYEIQGKRFGGSIALNDTMRGIYERLHITEYRGDDGEDSLEETEGVESGDNEDPDRV